MSNENLSPTVNETTTGAHEIMIVDVEQELRRSYLGYAVSTLVSRALPDIRDGFKPVQRRILYAMRDLGISPNSARVKSAKVVGECFVAGTLVSTPNGLIPIEELNIGDEVYTQNGTRRVTQTYIMPPQPLLEVELSGGRKNVCTPGQQFKVLTENLAIVWKDARNLSPGEYLLCEKVNSGRPDELRPEFAVFVRRFLDKSFMVSPLESIREAEAQVTYDIQVEEDHEFIANGMLAHNCMGNYHPHGDAAIYGTLVRMAQDFSMRYPLVDPQGNFGCFTGDTKIKLLDGTEKTFTELASLPPDQIFYLYSVNKEGEIVVGEGRHSRITRRNAELVEVTLDSGEKIRCTPDHRFLLQNGKYKQAQYLTSDDCLMSGYVRREKSETATVSFPTYKTIPGNPQVISVITLDKQVDVYDITVDEHHNFLLAAGVFVHNSVDGDPPAAQRYTECRLTPLAMEMMEDIERDTVDWRPNYDQSKREPVVLPAKMPNFLCNGGEGIAVGMSTSVPPHNLREVVDACIYALDRPDSTPDDLMKFIPGPDFPTSGLILGTKGAQDAYRTGRGKVIMQAQLQIEPMDNGKNAIVVTELPYQVNKANLVKYIGELVKNKKVEGITDVNDFSDKHGMRVVIELRRDVIPKRIVNYLLKHTALRQTFGIIMLALVNGQPRLLNLAQVIQHYLAHRKEVVVRRTRYELARAKAAAHIREGLQIALNFLDEIIALIRAAPSSDVARTQMVARFGLTQIQAEAILNMQLRQIAQLERQKIEDEYKNLLKQIAQLEDILVTPARVIRIVKDELRALKEKFGDDRKTRIVPTEADDISEDDLIPEEKTLVTISRDGYMKRVPLDTYRTQKRGGRGVQAANLKEEDQLAHLFMATTTHYILFFTDRGRVYRLKAYEVPQTSRQARGQFITNFIQIEPDDKITAILPIENMNAPGYLLMATSNGEVKRTALSEFANLRVNGKKCFDIEEGDSLKWVRHTDGEQEVIMVTRNGMSIRFPESDVPERGYTAGGVRGIEMRDRKTKELEDEVVAMDLVHPTSQLLVAGRNGYGKRTDLSSYRAQSRGGRGIKTMDVTNKTGPVVDAAVVEPEDVLMVLSEHGVAIRMDIKGIRAAGRSTQGVKLINLDSGDSVATIERLISTDEVEEVANAEAAKAEAAKNGK